MSKWYLDTSESIFCKSEIELNIFDELWFYYCGISMTTGVWKVK